MGKYISLEEAKGLTIDKVEEVSDEKIKIHFTSGDFAEVYITDGGNPNSHLFLNY